MEKLYSSKIFFEMAVAGGRIHPHIPSLDSPLVKRFVDHEKHLSIEF